MFRIGDVVVANDKSIDVYTYSSKSSNYVGVVVSKTFDKITLKTLYREIGQYGVKKINHTNYNSANETFTVHEDYFTHAVEDNLILSVYNRSQMDMLDYVAILDYISREEERMVKRHKRRITFFELIS